MTAPAANFPVASGASGVVNEGAKPVPCVWQIGPTSVPTVTGPAVGITTGGGTTDAGTGKMSSVSAAHVTVAGADITKQTRDLGGIAPHVVTSDVAWKDPDSEGVAAPVMVTAAFGPNAL
jgi:hypothetical protein